MQFLAAIFGSYQFCRFDSLPNKTAGGKTINSRGIFVPIGKFQDEMMKTTPRGSGTNSALLGYAARGYGVAPGVAKSSMIVPLFSRNGKFPSIPSNLILIPFAFWRIPAPHHQLLEGPVEAPTSSNSAVANPTTDSSSVSTGLDTPPDPEIHRGPLTLSKHSKHST
ncbi:hypothetical protein LXL04_004431 [Taraxacum kok-saghyz]